ncbi:MAG: 50S ribosomal protein L6 [Bacteroidota bacterium]
MSRIGNKAIKIPRGVAVDMDKDNVAIVKGPRGVLSQYINPNIALKTEGDEIVVKRSSNYKQDKALHGLYRSLIQNMVVGVTQGYKKSLELVGLGYKARVQNNILEIHVGYSHVIYFGLPPVISGTVEVAKGRNPIIHIEGNDKQLVGQVAAKIRSLRKPEPYKGKGIRFLGEKVRRKLGKTAGK